MIIRLLTEGAHHRDISIVFIIQNIFFQGKQSTQFYRMKGGGDSGCSSPPIIFERQILLQQTMDHWKENLTASRIHFKYWKIF